MFPHRNTHKYTRISPGRNNYNQIGYILIDRRHSTIPDVRSFRGADSVTVHYLVVAKVREKLEVSKRAAQEFNVERFYFRKLNGLEDRRQYQIKVSNRFAGSDKLNDNEDINRDGRTFK